MSLLKPIENGRMYPGWHRWNVIAGCLHDCSYCYMKSMSKRTGKDMMKPVFRNGENGTKNYLKDNLGSGRKIFVCSSGDMWGEWVEWEDIAGVLEKCGAHENTYMFLTKNPARYLRWTYRLCGLNCVLGVTIESDIATRGVGIVPDVLTRLERLRTVRVMYPSDQAIMVSIEPVKKFTVGFAERLREVTPDIVYVGVDSGNNGLPEPTADELQGLIDELRTFTDVRLKAGIERILGGK